MISSNFYNIFSAKSKKLIQNIKDLNHNISLHFDPTIYGNFVEGFLSEKQLLKIFLIKKLISYLFIDLNHFTKKNNI